MTVRLAVIGCGAIARRVHLGAFKQCGVDVVAFASRSLSSAEAAATEWGGGATFDDWHKVIQLNDVDAVDICSPNALHAEQAIAAAKAGKHVLVEKPMAIATDEADSMIAAASEAGVVLHVAHNMRHVPGIVAAREAVSRIGEIVAVRAAFGHSGPRDWARDAAWFFEPALSGGGALIDLGIHIIDVVRYVTRLEATTVQAMTYGTGAVEEAAQLIARFDNGATGSVHASWVVRPAPDFSLMIFGTEGRLGLDARSSPRVQLATGEEEKLELPSIDSNPCSDFVAAIEGGTVSGLHASAEDGRSALAIVCAAYESARSGRTAEVV